jgi:hypothetical protein
LAAADADAARIVAQAPAGVLPPADPATTAKPGDPVHAWSRAAGAQARSWFPANGAKTPARERAANASPGTAAWDGSRAAVAATANGSATAAAPAPADAATRQQQQAVDALQSAAGVAGAAGTRASALAATQGQPPAPRLQRSARRAPEAAQSTAPAAPPTANDAELPVYPGAALLADQSDRRSDADGDTLTVVMATPASLDQVQAFYRQQLSAGKAAVRETADGQTWRVADAAQRHLQSVRVGSAGGATIIELSNTRWH